MTLILSWLFKFLGSGILGKVAGVLSNDATARAQVGAELARTMASEAAAREETKRAYVAAGWWWMTLPFLLVAGSAGVYFAAIVADTLFMFPWNVEKLPPPFDGTMNQIILLTGGVSGATGLLGLLMKR